MATDPTAHYEANRPLYDSIESSVKQTGQAFLDADRPVQRMLLDQAVTFALLSAQTPVHIHERGYLRLLSSADPEQDAITRELREAGVNYCVNKARYVFENMTEADSDRVIDQIEAGVDFDGEQLVVTDEDAVNQALRATADEFLGVGLRKGAYALAKLGLPRVACIDTHVAQMAGIDPDDIYNGVVPEKYFDQWQEIESTFPDLRDQFDSRFMFQWVLFDANREQVTTHDAWFMSLPESVGVDVI